MYPLAARPAATASIAAFGVGMAILPSVLSQKFRAKDREGFLLGSRSDE